MRILSEIKNAKPEEMDDVLKAVRERYAELYPDWEVITISLEKAVDKNGQIDRMIALLERMKEI